jgi:predicted PurR-regulated permease PerM
MAPSSESVFVRRVLIATCIVVGVAALVALAVAFPQALLLFFAAILAAMALDSLADPLQRWLHLPRWLALLLGMTLVVAALGLIVLFSGRQLVEQAANLADRAPAALERLEELLLSFPLSRQLLNGEPQEASRWFPMVGTAWRSLLGTFTSSLSALGTSAVLVVMAFFLALDPRTYLDAFVRVIPPERRPRVEQILANMGSALRWWLVGRLIAMAAVAVLTFLSLTLLGVPAALLLSLLAGILTFIPYVGPILAAVPALLVALSQDPTLALWVPLIYSVIQGIENNLLTPLIQARTADIPPAYAIAAQFVIGVPFGLLGLALATPLLIVIVILVQMAYIEDVLGERVQVIGADADSQRDAEPLRGVGGEEAVLHRGRRVRE